MSDLHTRSDRRRSMQRVALLIAAAGLVGLVLAWLVARPQLAQAYLVGWRYWFGISLGCLSLGMLQHLTGGAWAGAIRRTLDAAASLLPALGLAFIPLALSLAALYPWANDALVAHDPILEHKRPYLNREFFLARAVGYFLLWTAAFLMVSALRRHVADQPSFVAARRLRIGSGLGLLAIGLAVTFAAVDWTMSLEPHWYSSVYGVLILVGDGLSAVAAATALTLAVREPGERPTTGDAHDLGNLLLLFTMLWAYIAFSQFLIIWYANLPEEVVWYQRRLAGGWQWIALSLVVFHFAAPFFALLPRDSKRNTRTLGAIALWILLFRWLDQWWLIGPAPVPTAGGEWHPRALYPPWRELAATAAVGGVWMALWLWRWANAAAVLLPGESPRPENGHE